MLPFLPPRLIIALFAALAFLIGIEAITGPLRPFVPDCSKMTFGFCIKRTP